MRYEVCKDIDQNGNETDQWVIWDTLEKRTVARFKEFDRAVDIVNRYKAASLAAESSME